LLRGGSLREKCVTTAQKITEVNDNELRKSRRKAVAEERFTCIVVTGYFFVTMKLMIPMSMIQSKSETSRHVTIARMTVDAREARHRRELTAEIRHNLNPLSDLFARRHILGALRKVPASRCQGPIGSRTAVRNANETLHPIFDELIGFSSAGDVTF
jgi:hypothetical protein